MKKRALYTVMLRPSIGPKLLSTVQIVLVGFKFYWLGPNHFGQVQIRLSWTDFYNLDPTKTNWISLKWFLLDPNSLDGLTSSKMMLKCLNHFSRLTHQMMIGPFRAFPSISSEVPVSAQSSRDNDMGDKTFTNNLISAEKTHYIQFTYRCKCRA